jgi:hypothetical protein
VHARQASAGEVTGLGAIAGHDWGGPKALTAEAKSSCPTRISNPFEFEIADRDGRGSRQDTPDVPLSSRRLRPVARLFTRRL